MRRLAMLLALLCVAGTTAACGAKRVFGWESEIQQVEGNLTQVLADAEAAWLERDDPARLEAAIELYEQAIAINPNQKDVLTRLARAYYFLADGYNRADPARQIELYDAALAWGERAMATDPDFVRLVREEEKPMEEAIAALEADYIGAVYWSASALGKWARLKGFTTLLAQKNRVKAMMEWVTEQDETFYYGGPRRYWGAYYSIAPSFAGGDTEVSWQNYQKSLAIAPDFLGTKVLMADTYATKIQDRALYERLLNEVIAADPTVIPDVVPEQRVEQVKAKELLAKVDDLFATLAFPTVALLEVAPWH